MSDKSVEERVIRVFADFKKVAPEEITMDTTFDQLGFDSLDGLNLVFELEEEFDVTIPDDRVADMRGVRHAVEGIETLLDARSKGVDGNPATIDESQKRQAGVNPAKAEQSEPADAPETGPVS